ncbi:type I-E CRISPR-associated protein Cas6/Cse3/CasE [Catenulispora sp. NL8]|uniref:Type I-E CRISPR-associated protein Cas6/Cse3/CasE n=1 Tax=Catenulispora pinistramenti TaxID=2705254 RepID=A0ABS5KHK0_9ACTN|nr:type I-E CRISPR-associated protein Cas6/Cse3/CasE [Catenulispora pinistramenti]MBS2545345.1 type I-E CRISPR-associated protein Cas6/Cse3/CasE [Catenulispora pinistramenti]
MSYLSRILINPRRRDGQVLLTNPHVAHGMITAGIVDPDADRPLWRIDVDNPHRPHLLVLTRTSPDWTHIIEQAGWPASDTEQVLTRDYSPALAHVQIGRQFGFRLAASPTQSLKNPQKPGPNHQPPAHGERRRGQRVAHRTAAHQLTWFLQHCQHWGFEIPEARTGPLSAPDAEAPRNIRISARDQKRFQKQPGSPATITITTATFEGVLTVTDPETLRTAMTTGIGPSKAYGCGLLTLAPLPPSAHG